jgi:hypothetical protein
MEKSIRRSLSIGLGCAAAFLAWPVLRAEQQPPPINGVTGTMALEGTVDQTSEAGKTVIVIHDFAPNISYQYIETLAARGGGRRHPRWSRGKPNRRGTLKAARENRARRDRPEPTG